MDRPGGPHRKGCRQSERGRRGKVRGRGGASLGGRKAESFGRVGLETAGDGGFCLPGVLPAGRGKWESLRVPSLEGYCDGSVLPMGLRDVKCLRHLVCLYIYFFFLAAGPSSDVHAPGLDS